MALRYTLSSAVILLLAEILPGVGGTHAETWQLDNLESIAGHEVLIVGDPKVVDMDGQKGIMFDGLDDGIVLPVNPVDGWREFTAEVIFLPASGGLPEQRFVHIQEESSENRALFETRILGETEWFLDTFIRTGEQHITLFAEHARHPLDRWHHAAIVVANGEIRHYVDGVLELGQELDYVPMRSGNTSVGMRFNRIHWFRGAVRTLRFSPTALTPEEFLTASD